MRGSYLNVMQNKHNTLLQPTAKDWTPQVQRNRPSGEPTDLAPTLRANNLFAYLLRKCFLSLETEDFHSRGQARTRLDTKLKNAVESKIWASVLPP